MIPKNIRILSIFTVSLLVFGGVTPGAFATSDSGSCDEVIEFITSINSGDIVEESFYTPRGVTSDTSKRTIVADTGNDRIVIFDNKGNFDKFITEADGIDLEYPYGITTDSDNSIFVADTENNRIVIFDFNGKFVYSITNEGIDGEFLKPRGVAVHSDGRIIIADSGNDRVVILYSDYTLDKIIEQADGKKIFHPVGVAIDSTGRIIVAESDRNRVLNYRRLVS